MTRHASEFIGGFIVAVLATLVLGVVFAVIASVGPPASDAGNLRPDAVEPPAALDGSAVLGWTLHSIFVVLGAIGLGQFIWGNGIRPNSLSANHPSIYHTLSLPVSRTTLVLSRYLFAVGGAAVLMVLMLFLNSVTLRLFGHAVPLAEMGAISLMGFLGLCAITAAYGFLGVISDNFAGGLMAIMIVAVAAFAWTPVFGAIAGGPFVSAWAEGFTACAAALLLATVYLAKRRDF
jgi:hypothetical protein